MCRVLTRVILNGTIPFGITIFIWFIQNSIVVLFGYAIKKINSEVNAATIILHHLEISHDIH